jgi:hypothetical protein
MKKFKLKTDGTPENTMIYYGDEPVSTCIGFEYKLTLNGEPELKLTVVAPEVEIDTEILEKHIEIEVASIRECPNCNIDIEPNVSSRPKEDNITEHEAIVIYDCPKCDFEKIYPFSFDWNNIPKELDNGGD